MASTMFASSAFFEQGLNWLKTNGKLILVNTSSPASAAAARSDALAQTSSSSPVASTDFTIAAGDVSGYKITVAQWANLTVTSSGDAKNISITSCSSSDLMYYTTCNTKSLTTSDTVTIPAWDIEIRDPSS